jgi:hypothetical protein
MPVLTGMVTIFEFSAVGALIEMPAQGLGAALFNSVHRRQVAGEHTVFVLRPVGGAIAAENLR